MIDSVTLYLKDPNQQTVYEGQDVPLEAKPSLAAGVAHSNAADEEQKKKFVFKWTATFGGYEAPVVPDPQKPWLATLQTGGGVQLGKYTVRVHVRDDASNSQADATLADGVQILPVPLKSPLEPSVSLRRGVVGETADVSFYQELRAATEQISFNDYQEFINEVMCVGSATSGKLTADEKNALGTFQTGRGTPFPGIDAYQLLKTATEVYLTLNCAVLVDADFSDPKALAAHNARHGRNRTASNLKDLWTKQYLEHVNGSGSGVDTLPYLALIRRKLGDPLVTQDPAVRHAVHVCDGILQEKLARPCFLELIWSYWHEEAMLVQTLNAVAVRFQNQRSALRDPLATFDLAPLRPLSNLLWGYIQDEQHRLTVVRRAYEYDHHYGISLQGKAVPVLRPADSRSKFLEAFHNLLTTCVTFYKQDDNTMVLADAFPVLNALKEVHLLLTEGQHNQFGDLPFTARLEMLMQQWLLARPEIQQFLSGRPMMPYREGWMDRVDAMKKLQNWTDVSVTYFHDLARFGEQLLLSIRYGNWSDIHESPAAANWARDWRSEVKQYIHAYRAVTGVDLAPEAVGPQIADRDLPPSVHLRRRLEIQRAQRPAAAAATDGAPRRNLAGARPGTRRAGTARELEFTDEY